MAAREQVVDARAYTARRQSISATIIRACRACGEPGAMAYEQGSHQCLRCGAPLAIEDKGEVWVRRVALRHPLADIARRIGAALRSLWRNS